MASSRAPASVRRNIVANFAGRMWSALMALAFLPLYIRFLGIEAYGLIGVFISLTALLSVFDMGLSTTLSRELARLSARPGNEREARDLVRTVELIYWGTGVLLGCGIALAAPFIAHDWLNANGVALHTMEQAIAIMGLAVALQWPNSLYAGGLMGLQRQVLLNAIRAGAATLQAGGAVLVLWLVSPTIQAYFLWQILVAALHTAIVAAALWKSLPAAASAVFRRTLLAKNWRFAGGMTGITVLVVILTQVDKVVLSKMLALEMFGYYVLAGVVAGALNYVSGPIFSALFPRLTQSAGSGNATELALLYHKGSQLMAALVSPLWIILALFSEELMTLWLGDTQAAANTHLLVSLLATGTALNAFMTLPYALQLAHGWTALSLYKNVVSVAVLVPLLYWLIARYGAVGAALAWIALNAGYLLFEIPLMHRRLLRGSMRRWYVMDVGLPVALCLGIGLIARLAAPSGMPAFAVLLWILSALVVSFLCVALVMPHTREWVRQLAFPSVDAGANR
jgi:O-antigen/teichoic acid export membrane protein